ncbi:conjugal transfer protein TraB [Catellatospora coxensis]
MATIEAAPGTPFSQVAAAREEIESALDVRPGASRFVQSPDSARRGQMILVPVDQLRKPIPWPGPTAPGRSIADAPIDLGRGEDGEPLLLWLPGDPGRQRNSTHLGVVGMSGSGKTELLLNMCADVLTRIDAELHVSDSRKADQLPGWLQQYAHRMAAGPAAAEAYIEDLPALIRERARILGQAGHKQWTKGCGIPFVVAVFFEAAGVLNGNGTFVDVAESARSVGIALVVELQRATYDRVPTSVRANIGSWACLGVKSEDDAQAALSDETLDAGAAPWIWKDQRAGCLYAELSGVDRERWAMPHRAYFAGSEDERAAAITPWVSPGRPQPQPAPAMEDGDEEDESEEANGAWDPTDPPDDVDPAQPLAEPDPHARMAFGPLPRPKTPGEARAILRRHVQDLRDDGHDVVRPAELADVLEETGRSDSWLYTEMRALCEGPDALLRRSEHGVYDILTLATANRA